jgi:processive 1,2-diacylglycerol beta-glucosyltransferase
MPTTSSRPAPRSAANNLPVLAWTIDRLLDDPARLTAMRANATSLARPHAARDIASTLIG